MPEIKTVQRVSRSARRTATAAALAVLLCLGFDLTPSATGQGTPQTGSPSRLRALRPQEILREATRQLTFIRPNNQYVDRQTRKARPESTFLSRVIEYHIYARSRSPLYRLDWKLTLADYLGVFELMDNDAYPGASQLMSNPIEADRAQIRSWNRSQREQFVNTLTALYNPTSLRSTPAPKPTPLATPTPAPAPPTNPLNRPLPQTGDADRLKPRP